jgi:hypothetical protein
LGSTRLHRCAANDYLAALGHLGRRIVGLTNARLIVVIHLAGVLVEDLDAHFVFAGAIKLAVDHRHNEVDPALPADDPARALELGPGAGNGQVFEVEGIVFELAYLELKLGLALG